VLLLLAGCAAPKFVSAPTVQYPPFPDQSKKVEDPAKARIYLIRKEKFFGAAVGINFYGSPSESAVGPRIGARSRMRLIGEIGPGRYLCWEQSPHPFIFQKIEDDTNSIASLNLSAGEVYYLRIYLHSGVVRQTSRVEVLSEKDGQAMLQGCEPPDDYPKAK
jgi:hypothetical protein